MREIKFRAWIDSTLGDYMAVQGEPDLETLGSFMHHYSDCKNLMQYTGLTDKYGKEIFEGDLLEYKNELGKHKIHKIFYKNGGLCFNIHNDDFYKEPNEIYFYESCADMQSKGWIVQCEIIGNIYENPELLQSSE